MNSSKPKLSIVIPTHNRPHYLKRAIDSVLSQDYSNYEILIVDDGSTCNIKHLLNDYNDSRIKYFRHDNCQGVSAARNTGIINSSGVWVCFLDDDDEYIPGYLSRIYSCLSDMNEEYGFLWCGIKYVQITSGKEIISRKVVFNNNNSLDNFTHLSTGTNYGLSVKKECFNTIGLFDTSLYAYEDSDLLFRLGDKYKYHIIPDIYVKCHIHSEPRLTNLSNSNAFALDTLILRHAHRLKDVPHRMIQLYRKSAAIHYQLGNRSRGRKRILSMLKIAPVRWRSWKSWFCLEVFGTEQLGIRKKLGLRK